jgi:anti-sigma factor RsiW
MAWLDGELSAERAANIAAHVKACVECLAFA